jgi:hypothetical protein
VAELADALDLKSPLTWVSITYEDYLKVPKKHLKPATGAGLSTLQTTEQIRSLHSFWTLVVGPYKHVVIPPFTECLECAIGVILERKDSGGGKEMDLCESRNQLLNEWKEATTLYDGLVASVVAEIGVMKKEDFDRLMETARIAAKFADRTQKNFELHVETHSCCGQVV